MRRRLIVIMQMRSSFRQRRNANRRRRVEVKNLQGHRSNEATSKNDKRKTQWWAVKRQKKPPDSVDMQIRTTQGREIENKPTTPHGNRFSFASERYANESTLQGQRSGGLEAPEVASTWPVAHSS